MSKLHDRLVEYAGYYVGVTEATGENDGVNVEEFQRAVDGKAQGESWCASFVMFCIKAVMGEENKTLTESTIYPTEHCMTAWNNSKFKVGPDGDVKPGYIMIWRHGTTNNGHTGIVTEVIGESISTIEGNTSDTSGVNRDGDGVYRKIRNRHKTGDMIVVGFIDPFANIIE